MTTARFRVGGMVACVALAGAGDARDTIIKPAALPYETGKLGVPSATVGSPDRPGLYMFFVRYSRGMRSPLHVHSDDRMLTVLRGTLYVMTSRDGAGQDTMQPVPAGSSILIKAGTPHFGWARDGRVLTQEIGNGPTSTTLATDPRS